MRANRLLILSFISALAIALCISSCGKDKPKTPNKTEDTDKKKDKDDKNNDDDKGKKDDFTPSGKYDQTRVVSDIYLPADFRSKDEILSAYTKDQRLSQLYAYQSKEKDPTRVVFETKEPNTTHFMSLTYNLKPRSGSPLPENLYAQRTYKAGELINDAGNTPEEKFGAFITKAEKIMEAMHFIVEEKTFNYKANGYIITGLTPGANMECTFLCKRSKSGQYDIFKAIFYPLNNIGTIEQIK